MGKKYSLLLVFAAIQLLSCNSKKNPDGPYFGNGFHNGWADQHSIVIWTRLTSTPEMKRPGKKFLVPSADEARELAKMNDPIQLNQSQLPEDATLEQMEGACPGKKGEVKLVYFPLQKPELKSETEWSAVDPDKNFTHQ